MAWPLVAGMAVSALGSYFASKKGGGNYTGGLPTSAFESWDQQRYLPPSMRFDYDTLGRGRTYTGNSLQGDLSKGISGIGELMSNPGGLNPNIAGAIGPRAAVESEGIAQNYRGMAANQQGMAARTNQPVSIKNALASAMDIAQSRDQRNNRRNLMTDSENLRRGDLNNTYKMLDSILAYINGGRGIGAAAQQNATQASSDRNAAIGGGLGSLGSMLSGYQKSAPTANDTFWQ